MRGENDLAIGEYIFRPSLPLSILIRKIALAFNNADKLFKSNERRALRRRAFFIFFPDYVLGVGEILRGSLRCGGRSARSYSRHQTGPIRRVSAQLFLGMRRFQYITSEFPHGDYKGVMIANSNFYFTGGDTPGADMYPRCILSRRTPDSTQDSIHQNAFVNARCRLGFYQRKFYDSVRHLTIEWGLCGIPKSPPQMNG